MYKHLCMTIVSLQVYRDVWSTPVSKPYMAHRVRGTVWGLHFCPFEDVLGVGHGEGFTSMLVPGHSNLYYICGKTVESGCKCSFLSRIYHQTPYLS